MNSTYKKSPFENAPKKRVNQTRFNHSHEHKAQMLPGYLIPCMRPIEVLPGDEISLQTEFFFRFAPLYFPIMHKITMRADYYYVPNRILWTRSDPNNITGWEDWISKNVEAEPPKMTARMAFNTLAINVNVLSFFGIPFTPPDPTAGFETHIPNLNAFPLSAYLMIWDWYERVPQLEDEIWFPLEDGDNTSGFETAFGVAPGFVFPLLSAKWEKDMFTSATPTPQVGDAIQIPVMDDSDLPIVQQWRKQSDGSLATTGGAIVADAQADSFATTLGAKVYLDIQDAAGTIKQLREAEVLQSFYERIMKVGDRYDDFIEGLWGNKPQPGIISIPVLLGSRFGKVQISDVMTQSTNDLGESGTSYTGDYKGQANLYSGNNDAIRYKCNEHGFVLCLIQLNANTSYGQGIDRLWRRSVQTDYALDMFQTIGDQEILKEEILYNAKTTDLAKNSETFGYIDRFAEYKWTNNLHVGVMNYNAGLSQHLGRYWDPITTVGATYDSEIEITGKFTNSSPAITGGHRLVDVFRTLPSGAGSAQYPTEGVIYTWFFHSIYINRSLSLYSTPKL